MSTNKLKKIFFAFVLAIAFLLRFFKLGDIPVGVSKDEASLAYNAYSILKTGKDEFGVNYPLTFKAFGEYKAPLYIYASVPFTFLLGPTEFSARFVSAFFGLLTIVCLYFLVLILFKKKEVALLSTFILAILPWHLQFTRIAYEGSLTVFLVTIATLLFIKGTEKGRYLILSGVFFVLSLYSHYSIRVFIPPYIICLLVIYHKNIIKFKKEFLVSILISILTLIPLLPSLLSEAGLSRASHISFLTDKGLVFQINEKRAEHNWSKLKFIIPAFILHNKVTDYSKKFIENYIAHFDLSFLFIKGDEDKIFRTPFTGLLPLTFLPLLLWGFVILFKDVGIGKWVVMSWFFLAPVSSSLTRLSTSANRSFIMIIPIVIVLGLGFSQLLKSIKHYRIKYIFIVGACLFIFEYIFYLDSYYIHLLIKNAGDSRIGSKELVEKIKSLNSSYEQIWITTKSGGYIHFLFYLKYPPADYQKQARLGELDQFGFGYIYGFDKYKFDRIPKYFDFSKNILYISAFGEAPSIVEPIYKIFNPDGQLHYIIFDTQSVINQCPNCSLDKKPVNLNIYGDFSKTETEQK